MPPPFCGMASMPQNLMCSRLSPCFSAARRAPIAMRSLCAKTQSNSLCGSDSSESTVRNAPCSVQSALRCSTILMPGRHCTTLSKPLLRSIAGDDVESPLSSSMRPPSVSVPAKYSPIELPISLLSAPIYAVYLSDRVRRSKIITGMPFSYARSMAGDMLT